MKPTDWGWHIGLEFKPQDLWIGAYWNASPYGWTSLRTDIWICLVPILPIHITNIRRNAG